MIVAHLGALKVGGIVIPFTRLVKDAISLLPHRIKPKSIIFSHSQSEMFYELEQILDKPDSLFVTTEIVSQIIKEDRFKSFWYEINFANPDQQLPLVESFSPAYLLRSQVIDSEMSMEEWTHGEILDHVSAQEKNEGLSPCLRWGEMKNGEVSRTNLAALYTRLFAGNTIEV